MPCRCRTSRADGRKAGSRSCCGYVGCYISGAQAPPRRTGAGNGLLPSHAGARAKEAFGRRQRLRSFRRGRRTSPASPRRVYGRPHHGFRHPQLAPRSASFAEMARVLKPEAGACILEFGTGKTRIWLGIYNFYLKRILPVVGRLSGDPGAYAYLARSIIEFPSADALSDEMRAAGFKRIYHIPLCSGIVCLHVAEKG